MVLGKEIECHVDRACPYLGRLLMQVGDKEHKRLCQLVEYLRSIGTNHYIKELHDAMIEFFDPADFSTEGRKKALENIGLDIKSCEEVEYNPEERNKLIPERIML